MNALSLYAIESFFSIFFAKRNIRPLKYLTYILYLFLGIITYVWAKPPLVNVVFFIILVLIISTNFEASLKGMTALSCVFTVFRMITEIILLLIYSRVLDTSLEIMSSNQITMIIATGCIEIVTLVLVKAIKFISLRNTYTNENLYINSLQISVIPICSIIML